MAENVADNKLIYDRAKAAVLSRDYNLASRLYKNLLKSDPFNIELLAALGDIYQKSGRDADAIPLYKQIVSADPNNVEALNNLGSINRRIKKYDDSISYLEQAVIADETNVQTFYNLGFTYKLMGKYDDALKCFETVIEEKPEDVLAYNHLGSIYDKLGKNEQAVSSYLRGLKVDANHPILHLNLAKTYSRMGRSDQAAAEYEAALRSKPGWLEAIDGYADLLLDRDETKDAINILNKAISLNPQNPKMHAKMGDVYVKQEFYDEAEHEYNTSLKYDGTNTKVLSSLANAYDLNGKSLDALQTMERYEQMAPEDLSMLKQYAKILLTANKLKSAKEKIKKLWERNSHDVQAINLLGQYYICHGDEDKADNCFKRIEQLDPSYKDFYKDSGRRYHQTGNFEKAEQKLKKYLETNPEDAKAISLLASSFEKQNKYSDALSAYKKLSKKHSSNPSYTENLRRLSQKVGESPDADIEEKTESFTENKIETNPLPVTNTPLADTHSETGNEVVEKEKPSRADRKFNEGLSFETLTQNDESSPSPFDKTLDDEIFANKSSQADLDTLVPSASDFESDDDFFETNPFAAPAPAANSGPVESPFESAFEDEDIGLPENKPSSVVEVNDGFSDEEEVEDSDDDFFFDDEEEDSQESDDFEEFSPNERKKSAKNPVETQPPLEEIFDEEADEDEDDDDFADFPDEADFENETLRFPKDEIDDEIDIEPVPEEKFELPEEKTESHSSPLPSIPDLNSSDTDDFEFPEIEDITPQTADDLVVSASDDDFDLPVEEYVPPESQGPEVLKLPADDIAPEASDAIIEEVPVKQVAEDAEDEIEENTNEELVAEEEKFEAPLEETLSAEEPEIGDEEMMAASAKNSALDYSLLNKTASTLSTFMDMIQNKDYAQKYQQTAKLFEELKSLSNFLPAEKKDEFILSKAHLQLEYIVKKLGGAVGLLSAAEHLRSEWGVDSGRGSNDDVSKSGRALVTAVFTYMRSLISSLPDKKLAMLLDSEVSKILNKLL